MPPTDQFDAKIEAAGGNQSGAIFSFPFDRSTVERFRMAFPRARWRDQLRAWFVPGVTAERRLRRWWDQESSKEVAFGDEKGRDAFAFDPITSPYLEAADDLVIRTPYSRAVIQELRLVPWARWDEGVRAWRVPFRSWEELRRRWPTIEAAAERSEPELRRTRQMLAKEAGTYEEVKAKMRERLRHRHPVPAEALPPLDQVMMTTLGAVIFTEIPGESAEADIVGTHYPGLSNASGPLVWAAWRRPSHDELVKARPSREPPSEDDRNRGWWSGTIEELRDERRKASLAERVKQRRHAIA